MRLAGLERARPRLFKLSRDVQGSQKVDRPFGIDLRRLGKTAGDTNRMFFLVGIHPIEGVPELTPMCNLLSCSFPTFL